VFPLIATVVGSYPKIPNRPRPARLRIAINRFDRGEISEEDLHQVEDEVTAEVLDEQAEAGLDVVTDGQIRWDDEHTYIARRLEGISLSGLIRWFDTNMYYRQPVIEDKVAWREPITAGDFRFAVEHSPKPVKPVLTGPYTLGRLSVDRAYGSLEGCVTALAEALNQEARALEAEGATFIQFNEPAILQHKGDLALFQSACRRLVDGLAVETATYLYFGDVDGLYPQLLDLPFDLIGLDFVMGAKNYELLRRTPFTKKLGLGLMDARNTKMERVEEVVKKIRTVSECVAADDIHVSPSAGLEFLPREVAQAKLARLAEGVRRAEEVLS
jgi:5-methyltetrahydropteroyltriglutamate--homocysteine methyltransferase